MKIKKNERNLLIFFDMFIIALSTFISNTIMALTENQSITGQILFIVIILNVFFCFLIMNILGMYQAMWRKMNLSDYATCMLSIALGLTVSRMCAVLFKENVTFKFVSITYLIAVIFIIPMRIYHGKTFLVVSERRMKIRKRTMIVGAGRAAQLLINDITTSMSDSKNPANEYVPICIVDDDKSKIGTNIMGVNVLGTTDEIEKVCQDENIEIIMFAIPSCNDKKRKQILEKCSKTGLPVKVMPYLSQIFVDKEECSGNVFNYVKDIRIEDLLGREPVKFDEHSIKAFIENKVCMVTGGGGSIGSEIVHQLAGYNPEKIVIVDIYENNAYDIQQEIIMEYDGRIQLEIAIASVRDYDKMKKLFETYKPQLVFHAAAHKHVTLMEVCPEEAVKNNVFGTYNVAELAGEYNVEKFVMISTDKAVNPTNIMGATKRCCEMIVQYISQKRGYSTEYITTRFGNVLGSNGSVIPLFKKQIERGKDVTVTHPDIVRFFMTIPEAVALVLQASSMAKGGEIFVLDMGEPVKIVTLAENLIRMYGKVPYKDVNIRFVGLRPGEKMFEEIMLDEEKKSTSHDKIYIGKQIDIDEHEFRKNLAELKKCAEANDSEATIQMLMKIVPTFTHEQSDSAHIS
ncbi:MAG: polysaccharide biosynthesis protein [Oscillospiraceae bacterium]